MGSVANLARGPHLCVIAMNPPLGEGRRTLNQVELARQVLGCTTVSIANMFAHPTKSFDEVNTVGRDVSGWADARPSLERSLREADLLVAAWGLGGFTGQARDHFCDQREWFLAAAAIQHSQIWSLRGEPRHPSRWHRFVADKYERTSGGTPEERLRQVLVGTPIAEFLTSGRHLVGRMHQIPASRSTT